MRWTALALLFLLGLAALSPIRGQDEIELEDEDNDDETTDSAFLLVRRHLSEDRPLEGKPITVTIELFNTGTSAASNVIVNETQWPDMLFGVDGDLSAHYDSIPAGATVQLTYSLTPKQTGPFNMPALTVKYNPIPNDAKEQVQRTSVTQFYVLTFAEATRIKLVTWGSKLTLGYLHSEEAWIRFFWIAGGSTAVWFGLRTYRSIKATSEKRKRQKALEELQKMK